MDFAWSDEQKQIREAAHSLASEKLNENLISRDETGTFNRAGWQTCADFGIHGLPVPSEYGGAGMDPLTTVGVLESLGYGCRDNGLILSINAHMWTAEIPILEFGSDDQKRRYLSSLCNGSLIGGNAMSEPDSGSDAYALSTTARRDGDHYVLNGSKVFVTNGPVADILIVFATTNPEKGPDGISAFIVEKGFQGYSWTSITDKMGNRTSPMATIYLDNCLVPIENRLGREGAGKMLFASSMTWERGFILASAVGSMQRILDACIAYARSRRQFGKSIGEFQNVSSKIVDMKLRVETARMLLYRFAWERAQGRSSFLEAALTKLHTSESWVSCAQDAIQIHGGYGYMKGQELERELRDAIGSRIYSGTSEIQRTIIASLLGL